MNNSSNSYDSLEVYFNSIKDIPRISQEEVNRLIQEGTDEALDKIYLANLRLVIKEARKRARPGVEIMDLVQEGNVGLRTAVKKYDPKKGVKFSTYAVTWIKQNIGRFIENQGKNVRVPSFQHRRRSEVRKACLNLENQLQRRPTVEEIAEATGLSTKQLKLTFQSMSPEVSMEKPLTLNEDSSMTFGETIEDSSVESPLESLMRKESIDNALAAVDKLSDQEREMIKMRVGLGDYSESTFAEIAAKFGGTASKAEYQVKRTLKKLNYVLTRDKVCLPEKQLDQESQVSGPVPQSTTGVTFNPGPMVQMEFPGLIS